MSIKYFIFYIIFVCGYHYYYDMKIIRYQHSVIKAEGMGVQNILRKVYQKARNRKYRTCRYGFAC